MKLLRRLERCAGISTASLFEARRLFLADPMREGPSCFDYLRADSRPSSKPKRMRPLDVTAPVDLTGVEPRVSEASPRFPRANTERSSPFEQRA